MAPPSAALSGMESWCEGFSSILVWFGVACSMSFVLVADPRRACFALLGHSLPGSLPVCRGFWSLLRTPVAVARPRGSAGSLGWVGALFQEGLFWLVRHGAWSPFWLCRWAWLSALPFRSTARTRLPSSSSSVASEIHECERCENV